MFDIKVRLAKLDLMDRLLSSLNDIKSGTYGQNCYEYDGGEYTRMQLNEKLAAAKEKEKNSGNGFLGLFP